jgi:dTDP-4-amino-4,6-dideoxygalactose transaminase
MASIPLLDLKTQYESLREDLLAAVEDVFTSGAYVLGPKVKAFEEQIASYCGTKHGVGVASGTDALLVSLMAVGVGPGDEVILPTYTFFATAGVVHRLGAKPVFVDIDPVHYNIDPESMAKAITDRTKAVIPVHLYGQCAPMAPIMEMCEARNIAVVEDAAQALGAKYRDRMSGSIGQFGCFSFYPTKNLGGYGDGGMITTNSDETADLLRRLRVHGARPKYIHAIVGTNSRLDPMQAVLLAVKLPHLNGWAEKRRQHADYYRQKFAGTPVVAPTEHPDCYHVYNQFVIRIPNRDKVMATLKEAGIGSEIYYPLSMHRQECFRDLGYREGDLPVSERASKETLSIPVHPGLKESDMDQVVETILGAL